MNLADLLDRDGHPDADAIVGYFWPVDGPHSRESVASAALAVDDLLRYLAHATAPWAAGPRTLLYAGDVYRLVGELRSGFGRLEQVLVQAANRVEDIAEDPGLYDDRRDSGHPAAATARELQSALRSARIVNADLLGTLDVAHSAAGHLGHGEAGT